MLSSAIPTRSRIAKALPAISPHIAQANKCHPPTEALALLCWSEKGWLRFAANLTDYSQILPYPSTAFRNATAFLVIDW